MAVKAPELDLACGEAIEVAREAAQARADVAGVGAVGGPDRGR